MPHDLLPWGTVFSFHLQWRFGGTWEQGLDVLRTRVCRSEGRKMSPSAAIVDSQSVKTVEGG
ncbi:hypothetical protein [Tautonia marina]|uniref:hypothetical protein n=1 Tax=Tautonia marina TaxID=2653855 RepID=UPI001261017A|nr:hypothetical protein [Tautonia marina]